MNRVPATGSAALRFPSLLTIGFALLICAGMADRTFASERAAVDDRFDDASKETGWQLPALFTIRIDDGQEAEPAHELESQQPKLNSLWSVSDVFARDEQPVVSSLTNRNDGVTVRPVRTLSIPTPLAYLGNPASWGTRFRAAYGSNFDDRNMLYGNVIINTKGVFGIDTEFSRRDDGRRPVLADSQFWVGDANLIYRLSQIRNVMLRVGAGINWLDDGTNSEIGFNTTYGMDIYIAKPWLISTTLDWGSLGSDTVWHWQFTGGIDLGRFELFIGYDFHQIGNRERKNLIAGAGFWF